MKMNGGLGNLIIVFVALLVGIILLGTLADQNSKLGTLGDVTDDTFTGAASCTQITTGCIDTLSAVENATSATVLGTGNYSLCRTATTGNLDGIILDSAEFVGFTLNATYTESPDCTYVADGTSRTLSSLVIIFFAIGVLAAAVYGIWKSGMMDLFS